MTIPIGRQDISETDIAAVIKVLQSDYLTQGPAGPRFEEAVAARVGAAHAIAVNSATSALHIACLALGLGPGDELWTVPTTFVASANCGRYCGASVDFVDIDPATFTMCPNSLSGKLAKAEATGRLPKIIVPVHLCGQPADMAAIGKLAQRYGVKVIEDASHAIGASYQGRAVGDCAYSDICVFSFHPVKIVTTGEGGVATTKDAKLARSMGLLRTHGITRDPTEMTQPPDGPWYYQQIDLGYNYRMTDIQAALGLSQLVRLEEFVSARQRIAERYRELLNGFPITLQAHLPETHSANHLFVVRINDTSRRRAVFDVMLADGIGVNLHYIPVHLQPYYRALGFSDGQFPAAEAYYASAISLPMFSSLTSSMQDQVVDTLRRALA